MAEISGENLVPGIHQGAAYVLGNHAPNALALLAQGQRVRELAAQKTAHLKQQQAEKIGKDLREDLQYKTTTGQPFQERFDEETKGLINQLADSYKLEKAGTLDRVEGARQRATLLNNTEKLRIHGVEKTKLLSERLAQIHADPTRDYTNYSTALGHSLIGADGKKVLATDYDPNVALPALDNDPTTYKEDKVVAKALHDVVPKITQRVAQAGGLGGVHNTDQVSGQLIRMKDGKPVYNADGSPQLNLDGGAAQLLDQGPVKVLADAREAAYNKQREEREAARLTDPSLPALPKISRNGHLSMMFGPRPPIRKATRKP
ncbi:hypothetical protein [Hymenobacter sp. BRD67]|uniref:hypothetical protein n=1 Tax=Hymenobacter sp. BRD67 TaxID=2675877 RepID=UPI001566A60A|nr:hypothetical protein [Hymenobacter sp. BRD67]QKG54387.1 hypothetical protein GKZ67_19500 [Hymenobacter sp. BRD67]